MKIPSWCKNKKNLSPRGSSLRCRLPLAHLGRADQRFLSGTYNCRSNNPLHTSSSAQLSSWALDAATRQHAGFRSDARRATCVRGVRGCTDNPAVGSHAVATSEWTCARTLCVRQRVGAPTRAWFLPGHASCARARGWREAGQAVGVRARADRVQHGMCMVQCTDKTLVMHSPERLPTGAEGARSHVSGHDKKLENPAIRQLPDAGHHCRRPADGGQVHGI